MATKKPIPVVRFSFSDGTTHVTPLAKVERQLLRQYHQMEASESPELRIAAQKLLEDSAKLLADQRMAGVHRARGGNKAAKAKTKRAITAKEKAVARFKTLCSTGERDAQEAMTMMEKEGYSRRTLQRHLSAELQRLGRGRRKSVKST